MKKLSLILSLFIITNLITFGQIPQTTSFQGVLANSKGVVVGDGTYSLNFKLFNRATRGILLWEETQDVSTANGVFNVLLGKVNSLNLPFDTAYWLEMSIGGDAPLTPRVELSSSFYSLMSQSAGSGTGDNLGDHTATQNINLNGKYLSGDGGNEGVFVTNDGVVGINTASPTVCLHSYNTNNPGITGGTMGSRYSPTQQLSPAIFGQSKANNADITYGVYGSALDSTSKFCMGVFGEGGDAINNSYGVYGVASGTGNYSIAVYGDNEGTASANYAGYFNGNVHVSGTLSKSAGTFKIDHPLDPESKYLVHSFVESPDMMNVYNGNAITDNSGVAIVELPSYFEALNIDFRYQLTCIGEFAQAIVAEEINSNQFTIKTDKPNVKVSWLVTGVRNDEYARANRVVPEVNKKGVENGKYIHPELFGKSKNEGMLIRAEKD